jgi:hypothetical protein
MRAFRNRLNLKCLSVLLTLACVQISACTAFAAGESGRSVLLGKSDNESAIYFPLAVGNSWRYSCSVEGEHAFDKTLSITASEVVAGIRYFRSELRVGDDPVPLIVFYYQNEKGDVHTSMEKVRGKGILQITANPSRGDAIGELSVSSEREVETPATGRIKAILVEKYSLDTPLLNEEQRMDWEGKYYAPGVGLVIEADGLGGECVLIDFSH